MTGYYRKIIRIRAEDSPNVRWGLAYRALHGNSSEVVRYIQKHGEIIPGVKTCSQYLQDRALLPKGLQTIQLDAEFPQGTEDWMYPANWLLESEKRYKELSGALGPAVAMGVDVAEGGDNTAFAVVSYRGLIHLESSKTPETDKISDRAAFLIRKYNIPPEKAFFDAGGGGTQHVHYMRRRGFNVQTVRFSEAVTQPVRRVGQIVSTSKRIREQEERYTYRNMRAKLYHGLRRRMDPAEGDVFAISREVLDSKRMDGGPSLREQMRPIPMWYDEGRVCLPRKSGKPGTKDTNQITLVKLIGCSPDELEAVLLGIHGLGVRVTKKTSVVGH